MLTGRREAPLQETAGLISAAGGLPALVAPADLTDAAAVEGLFAACAPVLIRTGGIGQLNPNTLSTGYAYQPRACRTYRVPWHLRCAAEHGRLDVLFNNAGKTVE